MNEYTPPYQRVHASLSTSTRLPIKCLSRVAHFHMTHPIPSEIKHSLRLPINEYTPHYQRVDASLSTSTRLPIKCLPRLDHFHITHPIPSEIKHLLSFTFRRSPTQGLTDLLATSSSAF